MGERRHAYLILVSRPEKRRPFGRPMCRWEDKVKMDLRNFYGARIKLIWLRIGIGGGLL
jgi:hypothetical protein